MIYKSSERDSPREQPDLPSLQGWRPVRSKQAVAAGFLVLCLAIGLWKYRGVKMAPQTLPATDPALRLDVQQDPRSVMIRWNPETIGDGSTGRLIIQGSARRLEVPLAPMVLRSGKF